MPTFLKDTHPTLWGEIASTGNDKIDLDKLTTFSGTVVTWLCPKGHLWQKAVRERTRERVSKLTGKPVRGASCSICSNKQILVGYNDIATTHPGLAQEFHPTKNAPLTAQDISVGYSKPVWWVCREGHEWETTPNTRSSMKSGCAVCANQKVLPGFNDLATTKPSLAKEWHPTKNGDVTPDTVTPGSRYVAWWQCEKGHEWQSRVGTRSAADRKCNCPVCANKTIIVGENDLATTHPDLVKQIDETLNPGLDVSTLHSGSSTRVVWSCPDNSKHTWKTSVEKRARAGQGCPTCSNRVSKGEKELASWLRSLLGPGMVRTNKRNVLPSGKELDIYIPSLNFAVEYNGFYWHSESRLGKKYHYEKWKECKDNGIQLFTVWEDFWLENEELVKRMLSIKLGKGDPNGSVDIGDTYVGVVGQQDARLFLDEYDLSGFKLSSAFYGLFMKDDDSLVAVLAVRFTDKGTVLDVSRFATSCQVDGSFVALLSYVESLYPSVSKIIARSNNAVSWGRMFEEAGFMLVDDNMNSSQSYFYAVNQKRVHRLRYTKQRFRDDPALKFKDGLSEGELARLNNLTRVWDVGNTRWVKQL